MSVTNSGVSSAELAKLTREEILADLVMRELRKTTVAWPLAKDLSSRLRPGQRYTVIPRSTAKAVGDTPNDGNELADSLTEYNRDRLEIDKFKTVHDYVYDIDQEYSSVDLVEDFYAEAAPSLAEQMEADLVADMIAAGTTKPESAVANPNKFQLAGTDSGANINQALTIAQVSDLARQMTEAKISKSNRYLMCSPKQIHELRIQDGIQDASKFGNNNAVVNGEVARLEGFTILESQDLSANQVIAFHGDAMVKAMTKQVRLDEERQSSKKRTFASMDSVYGTRASRDGELIWFGNEAV